MITLYGGDYEHILDLPAELGRIGIAYEVATINALFAQMIAAHTYEACEFSLANYIMLKDRGADWLTGIPVFPYRAFRHGAVFVRKDSSLTHPSQLAGKTVGVPDYSMTAAAWIRGIFRDQYGLKWSDIHWHTASEQRFPVPAGVQLTRNNQDLEKALVDGHLDALLTTGTADEKRPKRQQILRTLLLNPEAAERSYYECKEIYPIHHTIVIRNDALVNRPDLPRVLFDAYARAKSTSYQRRLGTTLVPWSPNNWKTQFDIFDGDPLPYGLSDRNVMVVLKLAEYLFDQKLIGTMPYIESLFLQDMAFWRG